MKKLYLKKYEQLLQLERQRLLPIFHGDDTRLLQKRIKACYEAGIRLAEYTNRSPLALATFGALQQYVQEHCPDMWLGAGTILDVSTAALFVQSGAAFLVAPNFDAEVAAYCNKRKLLYIPGCSTVNEIVAAEAQGCDLIKWFPAGDAAQAYLLKQLFGPLPYTNIVVTGGIKPQKEQMLPWLEAGAVAIGMGASLFPASDDEAEMALHVKGILNRLRNP